MAKIDLTPPSKEDLEAFHAARSDNAGRTSSVQPQPESSELSDIKDLGLAFTKGIPLSSVIYGGAKALGEKGAETLGIENDSGKSLAELYRQYQQATQKAQEEAKARQGTLGSIAEAAGNISSFMALPGGSLGARLLGSTVLGGLNEAGQSKATITQDPSQLASDIYQGAKEGLMGGAIGEGVGQAIGAGAKALIQSPYAQQMAAVYKNKLAGGPNVFSQSGKTQLEQIIKDFSEKTGKEASDVIAGKQQQFREAMSAADKAGIKIAPSSEQLVNANELENLLGSENFGTLWDKYKKGTLSLSEGNSLRSGLKDLLYSDTGMSQRASEAKKLIPNIIDDIETASAKAGQDIGQAKTDLGQLNAESHNAYKMVESALDKANISGVKPEQIKDKFVDLFRKYADNIGTEGGERMLVDLRDSLGQMDKAIAAGKISGINTDAIRDQLNKLSLLRGAQESAGDISFKTGLTTHGSLPHPYGVIKGITSLPLKGAQYLPKAPTAEKVADLLLESKKMYLQNLGEDLSKNPTFQKYGKQIKDAIVNGTTDSLNPVLFTLMQNPDSREIVNKYVQPTETNK